MDVTPVKSDASAINLRPKPAVPKKPTMVALENDASRKTHVRDMIRKLQEREQSSSSVKPKFLRKPAKAPAAPDKEEMGTQAQSSQTLEDLKAIDEDIEKLREQIEERDKIISALREAAEAKDKKLDNLVLEYSKLRSNEKLEMDTSQDPSRATSSSPSSPPLCNGELCWTDSFVNKNYHEPVYAQLLNDHAALQKVYNDLRTKLESKESSRLDETDEGRKTADGRENAINLIMAEQIRALKEREAQLIWEAEELREQNDLMEFRILELEECRKEFLDKEMMNEGKHRGEKIVWRERDIEEVSDSGVMSLPTSEDLTSDSELGEAIRNYSPLGPVTNPGLSTPENSHSDAGTSDLKLKKSLKSSECLQESGIFVDSESSVSDCTAATGSHSKACQTESVLDKTLLDIIDSSCDLFLSKNPGYLDDSKSDDLTTEISKLSVIQKRIQQKTNSPTPRSPHTLVTCPHSNSLLFYEERLVQLEDKLKIYESSGDTRDILLARRLQKEVELAHRVKELTDKVTSLEASRRKLEEEKCEFEEAENDARFQCQRLEIRLQELIDKNTELELEVERLKVIMNEERRREKKKGSLEGLLNKYEQRNFELEEKELQTRQRLSVIEAAMPAIVAYNMFKIVRNADFGTVVSDNANVENEKRAEITDPVVFQRLEEVLNDQKKLRKDYKKVAESAADREKFLRIKIEELEAKAAKDREMLEEMTNTLKALKSEEKSGREVGRLGAVDRFEELKHMVANEIQLKAQVEWLEQKEQVYMQSLVEADEIWAEIEAGFKQKLQQAEEANSELQKRFSQLEKTLAEQQLRDSTSKIEGENQVNLQDLLAENSKLKREISRNQDEKFEERNKFLEVENASLKEELKKMEADSLRGERNYSHLKEQLNAARAELEREKAVGERLRKDFEEKTHSVTSMEVDMQGQISELTQELSQKSKELSSLEVTVAELREEVETLENKVAELVETIQTTIKNQDEASSTATPPSEASQWPLSVQEQVCHVSVVQRNPFREGTRQQVPKEMEDVPVASEIFIKKEKELPNVEVLIPRQCRYPFVVFAAVFFPRHDIQSVFACSNIETGFLVTGVFKAVVADVPKQGRTEVDVREEEIFQLSLRNTELQQTLERMEEESKWKEREFEELQKIALEIRREQENLQELYLVIGRKNSGEEEEEEEGGVEVSTLTVCDYKDEPPGEPEPGRTPSIEILQMINPIVVKTSEQVSTTFSSLQIAFDNLQSKYRSKYVLIKSLLDQLGQKGDNRDVEDMTKQLALECASDSDMKVEKVEGQPKSAEEAPEEGEGEGAESDFSEARASVEKSSSAMSSAPVPKHLWCRPMEVDPDFAFAAPITIIRKVGDDGIFLEWDIAHQPENVTGFEIKVNGLLMHRVRSSSRNKALLRPLNLKEQISIHLFAISENGRSMKSTKVTYPDDYFLLSREGDGVIC